MTPSRLDLVNILRQVHLIFVQVHSCAADRITRRSILPSVFRTYLISEASPFSIEINFALSFPGIMEGNQSLVALLGFLAALCVYFVLNHFIGFRYDRKEPPLVPQRIPYIGHLIGIIRHGPRYYSHVRYDISPIHL